MPALANLLATRAGVALEAILDTAEPLEGELLDHMPTLTKRIYIPCCNSSSPSGLVQAETTDPWQKSGKYALAWVYFCIILLVCASAIRWYQYFNDKIRTALQEEKTKQEMLAFSPDSDFPMSTISSMQSTQKFFPPKSPVPSSPETSAPVFASRTINKTLALVRSVFYRPMPTIRLRKGWRPIILPSLGAITIIVLALILVLGYDLIPQPWYWQSIRYGSPPVAIRAGMIAVAMVPWIIALSMKANFITLLTGIGHERLNVLHRWLAYIFILLSLIHTIPFYITPIWDAGGYRVFRSFFTSQHVYVYGSGKLTARFILPNFADMHRHLCARSRIVPWHSLLTAASPEILRAVRGHPRSGLDPTSGNTVLALSQLSHVMGLPLCYSRHLADISVSPAVLPELDKPVSHVMAHRRGSGHYTPPSKRSQSDYPDPDEVEAGSVRLPTNARYLLLRKPPLHDSISVQR